MPQETLQQRADRLAKQYGGTVTDTPPPPPNPDEIARRYGGTVEAPARRPAPTGRQRVTLPAVPRMVDPLGLSKVIDLIVNNLGPVGGAVGGTVGMAGGPAGAVGGAALGGAAGEGLQQLLDYAMGAQPRTTGEAVRGMGREAALQGAAEGVGGLVARGAGAIAPRLMQSALKPSITAAKDATAAGVPKIVQTMLDDGISVTRRGLEKLHTLIDDAGRAVDQAVQGRQGRIFPEEALRPAENLLSRVGVQVNPTRDAKAVQQAMDEFLDVFRGGATGPGRPMTVEGAQALKQGTYRQLEGAYGELKAAQVEAQKALAAGLRENIERHVPEVRALNAREGALLTVRPELERRLGVAGNANPLGLASVAPDRAWRFLSAMIDRAPGAKSLLARGLYVEAARAARVSPQVVRLALAAIAGAPDETPPPEGLVIR